jgi:cold shock CspA family protein
VSKRKPAKPSDLRGLPCSGRIVALVLGQAHGFIRIRDGRKVFFHRSDVRDGVSFGGLAVDQTVMFELFEDPISGPRALQVQHRRART